jgi:MFS transporter, FHS family, L-fucose permease
MKRSRYMVGLVLGIFFVISLLTNIIGPIIPDMIDSFHITLGAAALLPFAFFIAYGVMSIPAGVLLETHGEKRIIVAAFTASFAAALSFALVPVYFVAMGAFFIIGLAMAALQVAINPLLRVSGGEENYAFNSAFAQLVFGSASFVSPRMYSYLVKNLGSGGNFVLAALASVVPPRLPWISLYWVFAVVTLVTILLLAATRFPKVERTDEERVGTWATQKKLFRNRTVLLYFVSMFAYVGTEQGTADWMSKFLSAYHGYDPQTTGANAVSWFWGLLTAGCLLGMLLLRLFDSRKVLIVSAALSIVVLTAALLGPGSVAIVAFPLAGFTISVMWPIIVSLGLNSVAEHHGSVSGILCTAICGGAVVPLVIGRLGDYVGLRVGMMFLYLTLGWVLSIGFWARPIVANKTFAVAER